MHDGPPVPGERRGPRPLRPAGNVPGRPGRDPALYLPVLGVDLRSLRVLRLLRLVRVVKVGRYFSSLAQMKHVFREKKEELVLSFALMALLLVVAASLLYYCENSVQPDTFSSIPATMWWAVATLTTVGYGDMYPVTTWGRSEPVSG